METEIWNLYNQISDSFVLDDDDDEPVCLYVLPESGK